MQQAAAQLPWFHLCTLIDKLKTPEERNWYLAKTIKHNWSRSMLVMQIETGLLARQGQALTNFPVSLPEPQSDLARQLLKDPYTFDFLGLADAHSERELEEALVKNLRRFLAEMGGAFTFVGNQYRLEVDGKEVDAEKFWKILAAYEGFEISIVIREQ